MDKSGEVYLEGDGFSVGVPDLGEDGNVISVVDDRFFYVPVRGLISVLDGCHDVTGLPWWIVIVSSTLALRVLLMPVLILQLKKMARISELFPKLPPPLPPPLSGITFCEQFSLHRRKRRELGCPSYLWSFAFFSVQFPCFLIWMTSIRRMCLDGHPGFDNGGALWFHNLTDFSHGACGPIFPLLIAGLHFVNIQISFRNFKASNMPGLIGVFAKYYKLYLDILSLPLLVIGFNIPQGSLVYWVTNSSLTMIQQLSLRSVYFHNKLGLPDLNAKLKLKTSSNHVDGDITSSKQQSSVRIENLTPEQLLQLGLENMANGDYDKSLPLLRLATEKDPNLTRALIGMGQVLFSKKSLAEAADYFERAISKIKEDEELNLLILALFCVGLSRIQQGRKAEGIEHLKRLSNLKEPDTPSDKACYYQGVVLLGSTLFNEGQRSEAALYLRKAVVFDPRVMKYLKECEEGLIDNK